jgi:Mlc titration factor MtfA (ptsG expression regulator)
MLPALIIIPSFILTAILGLLAWYEVLPNEWKWIVVIPLAIGTGAFVVRRGLMEWWYAKYPPQLDDLERGILSRFMPYYTALDPQLKKEFEQRLALFRLQKVFQMRGADNLPGDIQLLVAATAIQLTLGLSFEKELFPRLGTIILFPKTFITPNINQQLHAVEFNEDKAYFDSLFLAVNTFVTGLKNPKQYYNMGLYGFAKALRHERGWDTAALPYPQKELLASLHVLRNFPIGYIFQYTGLYDFEPLELAIEHFFTHPKQMQEELPQVYRHLMNLLMQDPCNAKNPVIQMAEV